jgi:hypothetical protein
MNFIHPQPSSLPQQSRISDCRHSSFISFSGISGVTVDLEDY